MEYENAYYHVMNRGRDRDRKLIYHGKVYNREFLEGIAEAHQGL